MFIEHLSNACLADLSDEVQGATADATRARRRGRGRWAATPVRRRAPVAWGRGLSCDVVLLPGLAGRLFPRKPAEDPLLPDDLRRALSPDLAVADDRLAEERLLLRLAIGAATRRLRAMACVIYFLAETTAYASDSPRAR